MPGGIAAQESFDPKLLAPLEYRGLLCTVKTKLEGVYFSEQLKHTAEIADKICVIRAMTHGEADHPALRFHEAPAGNHSSAWSPPVPLYHQRVHAGPANSPEHLVAESQAENSPTVIILRVQQVLMRSAPPAQSARSALALKTPSTWFDEPCTQSQPRQCFNTEIGVSQAQQCEKSKVGLAIIQHPYSFGPVLERVVEFTEQTSAVQPKTDRALSAPSGQGVTTPQATSETTLRGSQTKVSLGTIAIQASPSNVLQRHLR